MDAGLDQVGPDVVGLRSLHLYALKGICAYAHHAHVLGKHSAEVFAGVEDSLAYLAGEPTDIDELLERAVGLGHLNLSVMELLDAADTGTYGAQQPTAVRTTPVAGKAILVSGHDLRDLAALLEQTKDTGINVYTHGEMLPAHAYPLLRAYPHLAGNYGGAWQDQQREFAKFPGPILMTSNCVIEPYPAYRRRIFTAGPVGRPGVRHPHRRRLLPRDPGREGVARLPRGRAGAVHHRRVRARCAAVRRRRRRRRRQERRHPALLPGRRLRRPHGRPRLLPGLRPGRARRRGRAHPRLRQVPSRSPQPWPTPSSAA
ncbi:hypothetical protein J8M50_25480 [Streptomyces acidiscabies]|nr:hypothetical protein [Streptomyces acidiscabies]